MVSFFFFLTPFFDFRPVFRGDTQPIEKKVRFPDAKRYAESFEQKKYLKTIIALFQKLTRPQKLMVCFGPI